MDNTSYIIKWLVALFILSILGFNVFKYISKTTNLAGYFIETGIDAGIEGGKKTLEMSEKGIKTIEDSIDKELNINLDEPYYPSNDEISGKRGYCYIGTDKGYRSCIYVGRNDTCMSGDIFPTMDVCINPKLRV
tara:strand:- start:3155 stop:3556 length:402 start_codon:yes stop_codon:yes gene_type:complete